MRRIARFTLLLLIITGLMLTACTAEPANVEDAEETGEQVDEPQDEPQEEEPAPAPAVVEQPVQITGMIEVSNALIIQVYFFENFVYLEDLSGFIDRDFEYEQPLDAQILGPVSVDEEGVYSYTLNLPAEPISPANDVDNDGAEEAGVQAWAIVMTANLLDDPFLDEGETGGWSTVYTSASIDSENEDEIDGGKLLIWAPDGDQEFPTGFGEDGLLFTEDDPVGPVEAGYTLVDLDSEPFGFIRDSHVEATLYEGDIVVNDLTELSWTEGFDALFEKASAEYPFTEMKGIDWDALYAEFAPRIAEAEANDDAAAYDLALRDFSWAIPDGHVGVGPLNIELFQEDTGGSYGMAIHGLNDGSVIVTVLDPVGPAAEAGIAWGATILEWNGAPIDDAIDAEVPWSSPFSSEHSRITQQYRYLTTDPVGTEVEVTFQNPDAAAPETALLIAEADGGAIFNRTSAYYGFDWNALPVEYEILDSGYGYIAINSLSDDLNLTIRLWEKAVGIMIDNGVPGIIIDLRHNSGGAPFGSFFASAFVTERIDLYLDYYYSDKTGQLETFRPPSYTEPDDDLYYEGSLAVLVSPACASACEDVAYVFSQLEQTRVIGYYPTDGIFGEVGRGQYELPGGYSFQIPTGLSTDMDGNIVIEGTGVVPDVFVPRTLETMEREYVLGEDVVLDYAIDVMNQPLGAGIVPSGPPSFATDFDLIEESQAGTPWMEDLARESYEITSMAGETYTYTVALARSRKVIWTSGWCTADQSSFEDNWSKIDLVFTLDGEVIPLEDFGLLEGDFGGPCRFYYAMLDNWPVGEHLLTIEVTFSASLNDGMGEADYPAGTHVYEYRVYIARE